MLRWIMPFLVAMLAIPSTAEAAGPVGKAAGRRAASQLPPGLPRANYKFRTTVAPATPLPSAQSLYDGPDVLFTPSTGYVRYIPPAVGVAWLPVDYQYQGPWYPGPSYWNGWFYGYGCGIDTYGHSYC